MRLPLNYSYAVRLVQWRSDPGVGEPYPIGANVGLTKIALTVSDVPTIEQMWEELEEAGMGPEHPFLSKMAEWETTAMFLRDPDGACLEVCTRPLELFVPDLDPIST